MRAIPASLCVKCKGRKLLCGLPVCPLLERFRATVSATSRLRDREWGAMVEGATPPSAVVGEASYPKVPILYNIPPSIYGDRASEYEDPKGWWGRTSLSEILRLRSSMVSLFTEVQVRDPWKLYEKELSLSLVSERPVSSEGLLNGKIVPRLKFDGVILPRGPSAKALQIRVAENPKVNPTLERLINDDLKASEAIRTLYTTTGDVYKTVQALSLGLLGKRKDRRLVPTRWAITAVDSTLGKTLLEEVRDFQIYSNVTYFFSKYLGNYFHILFFPSKYRSVWVEIWHPMTPWAGEMAVVDLSEDFWGDYDYLDGGFMAARLAILEKMHKMRRQAGVIIVREITDEYYAPVGNWHIRETVRKAEKVMELDNLDQGISLIQSKLRARVNLRAVRSVRSILNQRTIDSYFS